MEAIKSSLYYDKQTGVITLPNINRHDNITCSICKNNDYICIYCRRCSLHDPCGSGVEQLTIQKTHQIWPNSYCRKCDKNYYNFYSRPNEPWCNVCYICNDCHPDITCGKKVSHCTKCEFNTYHCPTCNICLKHECHGTYSWNGCGVQTGFLTLDEDCDRGYSNICYMDRCSKCVRFLDRCKYGEGYDEDGSYATNKKFIVDSLWICRICAHIECGMCFYVNGAICSMCEKSSNRSYDHMDDVVCIDNHYASGNICGICDEIMYAKDYPHNQRPSERGSRRGKPSWFLPAICSNCAPNDTYTPTDIKRIRSHFPHINALKIILRAFISEIAYVIFEYYYEERHYLNGELD